jgi:hypothetical protein
MRIVFVFCAMVLTATLSSNKALAIKEFGEQFGRTYVEGSKNDSFKELVSKAKCNVCHIEGENKKKRNPYGEALHGLGLDKKKYQPMFKSNLDQAKKEVEELLKKCEEKKIEGEKKTFGEKIKDGELPGGDVSGKKLSVPRFISTTASPEAGFVELFDGKSLTGWKINESPESWKIENGCIVCQGPRSHLFYVGEGKPFKNFHLKAEVMTTPNSNAGIYFHTKFQESGWPKAGFECQVNISAKDPIKTSSIYQIKNVNEPAAKDNEWYTQEIIVQGKQVTLKVNGKTLVEYTEPDGQKAGKDFDRVISEGTFALQAHDPESKVYFKNLTVKRLD